MRGKLLVGSAQLRFGQRTSVTVRVHVAAVPATHLTRGTQVRRVRRRPQQQLLRVLRFRRSCSWFEQLRSRHLRLVRRSCGCWRQEEVDGCGGRGDRLLLLLWRHERGHVLFAEHEVGVGVFGQVEVLLHGRGRRRKHADWSLRSELPDTRRNHLLLGHRQMSGHLLVLGCVHQSCRCGRRLLQVVHVGEWRQIWSERRHADGHGCGCCAVGLTDVVGRRLEVGGRVVVGEHRVAVDGHRLRERRAFELSVCRLQDGNSCRWSRYSCSCRLHNSCLCMWWRVTRGRRA